MVSGANIIKEMEKRCAPVREGDRKEIERLSNPYIRKRKGLIALIKGSDREKTHQKELLAASEALLSLGLYREAVGPLEEILEKWSTDHAVRDLALSRAGQIAIERALPMDLSPLISELGLSRNDLGNALMRIRSSRGRQIELLDMEKALFQAMLLSRSASWIESDRLKTGSLKGALEGFNRALELSTRIKGEYHRCRCELAVSRFLLENGEFPEGMRHLKRSMDISSDNGFGSLFIDSLILRGLYGESEEDATKDLKEAQRLSSISRNSMELARAGTILGHRQARAGDPKGIDRIIHSAAILEELGETMETAAELAEAALWSIRLNEPERGISLARQAYRKIRSTRDREALVRVLCILFFAYIRSDSRNKAKKILMEIAGEHPVKQFPAPFAILKEAVRDVQWLREDKDTAHMFEDEIIHTISRDAVEEIKVRAREAYPNEFGAMLRGIEHITHIEPVMEGAANRSSFMFSLFSRFSQREVPGEGVVHSHPSGSANPSRADLSMFGRFPGINIIIAYPYEDDSIAAYDRMGNRVKLEIAFRDDPSEI